MLSSRCCGCGVSAHTALQRSASHALSSAKLVNLRSRASSHTRRRLSCTFFSTTPFSQPEATLQKSASNR